MSDEGAAARYVNPVLDADWPDPDVVRVGEDYWLVAASSGRSPGLPVLHSRDLVSWTLVAHALPRLHPEEHFALPRHGGGVWAPAIRHHDGVFHVVYADPDHGVFVVSATDPAGPWSAPRPLLTGLGLVDPCPLWDDDGRTWLVHGFAKSRSGTQNRLALVEVDAGLTRPLGPERVVVDGDVVPGCATLEGPKLYRRGDWYWILAPAGGVTTGWQSAFRSRHVEGPYEHRVVMRQGTSAVRGPHQGAWVEVPSATGTSDWFLHYGDRGAFGRVLHLQPMTWGEDGWPVIGRPGPEGWGTPVEEHAAPLGAPVGPRSLPGSDDFADGLGRQWYWQANPGPGWADAAGGRLVLTGPANDTGNLRVLPQVLGQRLPGTGCTWTSTVALDGPVGARAGVVVLGRTYLWCGLRREGDGLALVAALREDGDQDETVLVHEPWPEDGVEVVVTCSPEALARVEVVPSAGRRRVLADGVPLEGGQWVGAEIGVFAAAALGGAPARAVVGPVRLVLDDERAPGGHRGD